MFFLPSTVTQLERQNILLIDSITIIKSVQNTLGNEIGEECVAINQKLNNVFGKKNGFNTLRNIPYILTEEIAPIEILPEDLTGSLLKYAPNTFSNVDRRFSSFKNIISYNGRRLNIENIKKSLAVQCNKCTCMKKQLLTLLLLWMCILKHIKIVYQQCDNVIR